jgi:hypothetical protein
VQFHFRATPPDTGGYVTITQLINTHSTYLPSVPSDTTKRFPNSDGYPDGWELDRCAAYPGHWTSQNAVVHHGFGEVTIHGADAPGSPLYQLFDTLSRSDDFKTYFLYLPDSLLGSVWVPVGRYDWSWSGTAKRDNSNHWDTTATPTSATVPDSGSKGTDFPTYFSSLRHAANCETLPSRWQE